MPDVVILGAGAMGSATAWWLARDGRDVVLLEQFAQGHCNGSSHGGSRIFRFAYDHPHYVRMAQQALPLWRELEADANTPLVDTTGGVDHGDPNALRAVASALAACDAPHDVIPPDEARERWPGMRFDGDVIFHPDAGRCRADAAVRALQDRAAAHGADVRFGVGHAQVRKVANGVEVDAAGETIRAPVAVVAAGAWVTKVLTDEDAPDMTVTQEQIQHFRPSVDAMREDEWPSFIHHRRPWVYGLSTPGEGVKVAEHHVGPVVDPDERPPRDPAAEAKVVRYVEEWFPGLDPTPVHVAECLYTTTPDESFVIERRGPIVIGSPCSGHGFKFTPLIGRRLADLAADA
jgi:sarcosine oxidase